MNRPTRRSKGGATIHDVARAAGVSPMTVSRVVNGGASVRQSTRLAVTKAIEALNYSPNTAARSLAGGEAARIGLLYSNPSAAYLSLFMVGAMDGCRRAGSQLIVDSCGESREAELEAGARLINDPVEGVILPPPLSERAYLHAAFEEAGIPAVSVAVGRSDGAGLHVRVDDAGAAYDVTRHLLQLGHRKIGFIRGHPDQSASQERWRGFMTAMREQGLGPEDAPEEQGFFSYRSGLEAAERLLASHAGLTAIFASNDDMAAATVNVAHRQGLRVPDDLSVAGFDDTAIATTVWPELTTVRQPIEAMAESALELLLSELRARRSEETTAPAAQILAHTLVVRESTAAPRTALRRRA